MKFYEIPEMSIELFTSEDVITTSNGGGIIPGENETEGGGGL